MILLWVISINYGIGAYYVSQDYDIPVLLLHSPNASQARWSVSAPVWSDLFVHKKFDGHQLYGDCVEIMIILFLTSISNE